MAICLTVDQKCGATFTVDVKNYAVKHIIPQLVALPVYSYKIALASLWANDKKLVISQSHILCILCADEVWKVLRGIIVLFLNLQVSVNGKSHLLDKCDTCHTII